jgi:hypothetical protein
VRLHRCVERVHVHVLEPCVLVGRLEDVWAAEAERPGGSGRGCRQAGDAPDDRDRDREERVALRSRVDDRRDTAARAQYPDGSRAARRWRCRRSESKGQDGDAALSRRQMISQR